MRGVSAILTVYMGPDDREKFAPLRLREDLTAADVEERLRAFSAAHPDAASSMGASCSYGEDRRHECGGIFWPSSCHAESELFVVTAEFPFIGIRSF